MKKNVSDAKIGDTIYTFNMLGNPINLKVTRIENKTEGGSTKWGKVFYDKSNNFITELKASNIFSNSEALKRQGYAIAE